MKYSILPSLVFGIALLTASSVQAQITAGNTDAPIPDALGGLVLIPGPGVHPAAQPVITVRDAGGNPVPGALVTIAIASPTNLICPLTVLTVPTNAIGEAHFALGGGGCTHLLPGSIVVSATPPGGGVPVVLRTYGNAKSPDYDGAGPNGVVDLADLIEFSNEFAGISPQDCHDYDNNGSVDIADLIIFSVAFLAAVNC